MWSNFFVQQDEEGRTGVAGQSGGLAGMKGGRGQRRIHKLSDSQEGKIKLAFFVSIVGVTLTVLGMGTEFWVELAQPKNFSGNQTCQLAHYGLWKGCIRTLRVDEIDPERTSCGPADLPGGETSEWCVCVCVCVNLCKSVWSAQDELVSFCRDYFVFNSLSAFLASLNWSCHHVTVCVSVSKWINSKGSETVCGKKLLTSPLITVGFLCHDKCCKIRVSCHSWHNVCPLGIHLYLNS